MSLKDKLIKLRDNNKAPKINWEKNKNDWLDSVNRLYKKIRDEWFAELEDEDLLKFSIAPISITEEDLGTYSVNKMEISYATDSIVLEPVGSNIIGCEGRIDLYLKGEYSNGLMLILFPENGKDSWFIIDKQNRRAREKLTAITLEKAIEQWI